MCQTERLLTYFPKHYEKKLLLLLKNKARYVIFAFAEDSEYKGIDAHEMKKLADTALMFEGEFAVFNLGRQFSKTRLIETPKLLFAPTNDDACFAALFNRLNR